MTLGGLGLFIGFGGDEGGWQLELFFRGRLLAALALQLALTVSGAESPRQCSGCKRLYIRTKKNPKIGESNYCDRCGRTEAMRQADKRRREKGQEARRLAMEGKSAKEISRILKVRKIKTVRDWISKGK
jgi:transposase-like protein